MEDNFKELLYHTSPVIEAMHFSSPLTSIKAFREQCVGKISIDDMYPYKEQEQDEQGEISELSEKIGVDIETVIDLMDVCDIRNLEVWLVTYSWFTAQVYSVIQKI